MLIAFLPEISNAMPIPKVGSESPSISEVKEPNTRIESVTSPSICAKRTRGHLRKWTYDSLPEAQRKRDKLFG
jgi:hypothetical protein